MLKATPGVLHNVEAFRPLLRLLEGHLITPRELGERWRYSEEHLCALRKNGRGVPFIRLDTGAIRYRLSEVIAAELAGTCGALNLERVCLALAACPDLTEVQRAAAQVHVRAAFKSARCPT